MFVCSGWFLKSERACVKCQENFSSISGISCRNAHFVCREDFQLFCKNFVESCRNDSSVLKIRKGRLHCPLHSLSQRNPKLSPSTLAPCNSAPYSHSKIIKNTTAYISEMCVSVRKEYLLLKKSTAESNRKVESFVRELRRAIHDPRQCGECGFGPVEINGCDDLISHHNEERSGYRTSNECPACGRLAQTKGEWPVWNGRLPPPPPSSASLPPPPNPPPLSICTTFAMWA